MFNPANLLKIKDLWAQFTRNHPKFVPFLKAVKTAGVREGMLVELTVTTAEGQTLRTNFRVWQSDAALYAEISQLVQAL